MHASHVLSNPYAFQCQLIASVQTAECSSWSLCIDLISPTGFEWLSGHLQGIQFLLGEGARHTPTLAFFDKSKPVTLSADSSSHSIGAVVLQEGRPVEFAAKSMTPCQQNYSQMEKELLATVFACKRYKYYC